MEKKAKKPQKKTYTRFNKTVTVGDTLSMKWANGRTEKLKVASFSRITNEPMTKEGKVIWLDYVVWK